MGAAQHTIFGDETYPETAGWKARDTSLAAAVAITPKAGTLRERVLAELRHFSGSPEQIAARIGVPLLSLRPRFSELAAKNLIEDTGQRAQSQGGKRAIVWRAL